MRFKEWLLQQEMTDTGSIAHFTRICIPLIRRMWPSEPIVMQLNDEEKPKPRKHKKKKKEK